MNTQTRRALLGTLLLVAALALVACGGGGAQTGEPPASPGGETVTIQNLSFRPSKIKISAGDTVTWINRDATAHTVSGDSGIESGDISTGASYSKTFETPGTYNYICGIHPSMKGTVIVE